MIRRCRKFVPNIPLHVVLFGFNRRACFYTEDDFHIYLYQLSSTLNKCNVSMHAYVLMPNHIHLLLTQHGDEGIDQFMRTHAIQYQKIIQRNYKITEPIWQKNYKACYLNPADYLIKLYQYIELNPVRAGLVDHAQEYSWSSFAFHALNEKNSLIKDHRVFSAVAKTKNDRQKYYHDLCEHGLSKNEVLEIKSAIQNETVMGDKSFNDYLQTCLLAGKDNSYQDSKVICRAR